MRPSPTAWDKTTLLRNIQLHCITRYSPDDEEKLKQLEEFEEIDLNGMDRRRRSYVV